MEHDIPDHSTSDGRTPEQAPAEPAEDPGPSDGPSDPLLELRAALDAVDDLPLEERAEVFDRTHAIVVEELRTLELG